MDCESCILIKRCNALTEFMQMKYISGMPKYRAIDNLRICFGMQNSKTKNLQMKQSLRKYYDLFTMLLKCVLSSVFQRNLMECWLKEKSCFVLK